MTVVLGVIFLGFQAYEFAHAYNDINLTLESGIYGSTFFMLTGFHGPACDHRRHHTAGHHAALHEGAFHTGKTFCLRGRRLVLALRRRGVAGVVYLRLLALIHRIPRQHQAGTGQKGGALRRPVFDLGESGMPRQAADTERMRYAVLTVNTVGLDNARHPQYEQ